LPLRVVRGLAPRLEAVEPLLRLAIRARILAVHVQTIGATFDVLCAHPNEVEQSLIEAGLTNLPLEAEHGLHNARVHLHEIDSSLHDVFLPPLTKTDHQGSCDTGAVARRCHRRTRSFV